MDFDLTQTNANAAAPAVPGDLITDSSTATFHKDVLETSVATPVIVDFWAPWCGPCRQLGPAIEKVVTEFGGRVKLVKINVDENQALAGQMGIQSIPAVFAFAGGRPVDGFMGALPESEIRRFVQKIVDAAGGAAPADEAAEQIDQALDAAASALAAGDTDRASEIYGLVLQHVPDHTGALTGLAQTQIAAGDLDGAETSLGLVTGDGQKTESYQAARAALLLKREAAALGDIGELEARVTAGPDDLQARFDLALALNAHGRKIEAAEALVAIMRRDREWNEDGARRKLLDLIEAWGPKDPDTPRARRLLSAALFA